MGTTLEKFYKYQLTDFKKILNTGWSVGGAYIKTIEPRLKPIHKRYLSLACLSTVIGYRSQRNEYVEGVVETAHLSLIMAIKGIENPTCVLLRQTIELVLKHIYFSTHHVEYAWVQSRENFREINFQLLLEYIRKTDEYRNFYSNDEICIKINEKFGVLSRYVHVHHKGFMGYSKTASFYRSNYNIIKKLEELTKEIWPRLTALLLIFFPQKYYSASALEKKIIRNSMPKSLLKKIDNYLSF